MKGVATRYPKFVKAYGRVMSVEDFLTVHGPETTGRQVLAQSADNLNLTMLVKMASNGMPLAVETESPEARAALARGRATFYRRVGERNHACADCHTPDKGANKFLGGRLLGDVTGGPDRGLGHAQALPVVHDAARDEHAAGGLDRVRGARALPDAVRQRQAAERPRHPALTACRSRAATC
jgi:hypothetical protein